MLQKILISTGGSGGHVIPAKILYEHLYQNMEIIISSDKRGCRFLENDLYNIEIINTPRLNNFFLLPINFLKIFFLNNKVYNFS